jgi:hypothetical protein
VPRDLKTEETVHLARWLAGCETIHAKAFRDPDNLRDFNKDMKPVRLQVVEEFSNRSNPGPNLHLSPFGFALLSCKYCQYLNGGPST